MVDSSGAGTEDVSALRAKLEALRAVQRARVAEVAKLLRRRHRDVIDRVIGSVAAWKDVDAEQVDVARSGDTEWHQVFFLSAGGSSSGSQRVVVNIPSWTGAVLANKTAASHAAAATGLAPKVLASEDGGAFMVCEYVDGGTLEPADLEDGGATMERLGTLYGSFHSAMSLDWFDAAALHAAVGGDSGGGCLGGGAEEEEEEEEEEEWASLTWVLGWMQSMVPPQSAAVLEKAGARRMLLTRPLLDRSGTSRAFLLCLCARGHKLGTSYESGAGF
eukprot:SAG22_NODE_2640_length_2347_cov_2.132117_3_plen_275_part_00